MPSKQTIRGRLSLALVANIDAVLLSYDVLLLLLALDLLDAYDMFFLGMHLLHIFTVSMAYIVVRHATTSIDTLRILAVAYFVVLLIDVAIIVGRILMIGHTHAAGVPRHMNALVTLLLAVLFVFTDIAGAFFTNLAQHSAFSHYYTNEQLATIAHDVSLAKV